MKNKELHNYLIEQFKHIEHITSIPMMGGYIFYYKGRIFGGIYEPGFMVKITKASKKYLPNADMMPPYKGAKDLILVDDVDQSRLLCEMIIHMYDELPEPKKRKKI
ncbi:MAG: TfoX/Sxy family protein [Acholeplasmataceae bacterium]|nr:TfoX/Sxy family protein [Acholeplasmataceae bacterium]